ncbi:MAG: delta-60 repeat domain-containing protein, partial [Actinomycetota bacterium]|nr:delta-60 repeat domain-containing protein [Actinomycetota bacterium]
MWTRVLRWAVSTVVLAASLTSSPASATASDAPFGSCGIMTLDRIGPNGERYRPPSPRSVVVLSNDDVLVLLDGTQIVRLLADGTPSPSFGTQGRIETVQSADAIAAQPDGRILAAGSRFNAQELVVSRHLPDGSLDRSFGDGGLVTIAGTRGQSADLALDAAARIIVAANAEGGSLVARLEPNGKLDPGFGIAGAARVAEVSAPNLAIQPDEKIVLAGTAFSPHGDFGLLRLTAAGALDATFGSEGYARLALEGRQHIDDVT